MTAKNTNQSETRDRFIIVFRALWGADYKKAETKTGVPAAKWKRLCNRLQKPTNEMITALAKTHPYFLQWVLTGTAKTFLQLDPNSNWKDHLLRSYEIEKS